jgi:uracil-DNA glycosylase family 4
MSDDTWEQLEREVITCTRCPRLVAWREEVARTKRRAYRDWDYWGKPVPGFGDRNARLMIVGLAPGAHGSNRTGRMFTGDSSGETLYGALYRADLANQPIAKHRDDGLVLYDTFITAVGRCVPPKNRPKAQELENCRPFLAREMALLDNLEVILALGRIAFKGTLKMLKAQGIAVPRLKFGHGVIHTWETLPSSYSPHGENALTLLTSYHPSRQNTQTGRLTLEMFDDIFRQVRSLLF